MLRCGSLTQPLRPASTAPPGAETSPPATRRGFHRLAAALTYRDFRILWLGAFASTVGTWMQKVAQNWLVLSLTGSAFYLGLDTFLGELPILLFTLVGGVIADRYDRRRLLIGSQYVQMACAFALASLVFWDVGLSTSVQPADFDRLRVWHILALSFTVGCAQAFGGPAYQSLIPSLVGRQELPNAIALNSIQFNLARIFGPLVAGVALTWGLFVCFALNGVSFLVVIAALMALHVRHVPSTEPRRLVHEMRSGLSYVRREPALVSLTALAFLTTFLGTPLLTLLPVVAQNVYGRGVGEYSMMLVYAGGGAVTGALLVAWLGRFDHMGATLLSVQIVFGLVVIAFALTRTIWVSHVLLFLAGASLVMVFSLITSLVQLIAPDHLRGRVMSAYMVAFRGGSPLGSLASGYIASISSTPVVLALNGSLLMLVAATCLAMVPRLRRL